MYTGCAPPAAPAVGNNRRPLPAIGGRFGLRPVSSYTPLALARNGPATIAGCRFLVPQSALSMSALRISYAAYDNQSI